jgi:type I restriction enzyme, R subunit
MSNIGKPERATQDRVRELFQAELGYRYLGDWSDRTGNSNIDEGLLTQYLNTCGYSGPQISKALYALSAEATNPHRTLYANNKAVYGLLRYGLSVKTEPGKTAETIHLIDWANPAKNDFAIAEEVTLKDGRKNTNERRPDVVLYINGIAIAVIELKNSRVSTGDGIRQNLSNQRSEFNAWFFSTVQFVFAGNDSEGLRYGTIDTEEKYFLSWKEDEGDNTRFKLDKYLLKICEKSRILELIHDFVLFDGGRKKLPRVHQYFGIKAAQSHVKQRKGGIIWHTQGAGKSILMVLLAKWILENNPRARVVIITDRDELDKQIESVFKDADETICRTSNGRELMQQLSQPRPRLLCSLVHKFGLESRGKKDHEFEAFIKEIESQPSATMGEVFVFVDECHRTQSGRLNQVMQAMMPNAVFIGFTGTPLLKQDKATSQEVFGGYIHTYKFSEAVTDGVVLDLLYEARDIDQRLTSQASVDEWFELVSKKLNSWQKDELKKQWGTMQNVLSSESRMRKVVQDMTRDFMRHPRLSGGRGNAILVASSIYEACKYFVLFQKSPFKSKCAVVTSYNPQAIHVTQEETGANTETDKQFIFNTYTELLAGVESSGGMTKTEAFEEKAKRLFVQEPANMKLLIVVDKLLTGFDAPPCTFLYIDKSMQDHGLFQAICRTNRLDGEDKDFGYIVDYKDLFKKVEKAIAVYTSELDSSADGASGEILLKDRLETGKRKLDTALEALAMICEPVLPPKDELAHIHYFCGNTEIATDLQAREPRRVGLYVAVVALVRALGNVADEMSGAGYSSQETAQIKISVQHYLNLRETIRKASNESLDLKAYEADMRYLIDTYIEADEPRKISPFDNIGLLDLIVKTGIADAIAAQLSNLKGNQDAIAETIENNVRSKIMKDKLTDPAFFERMSALLDEIIVLRRTKAIEYEEYLRRVARLVQQVQLGREENTPARLDSPGKVALHNALLKANNQIEGNRASVTTGYGDDILEKALQLDAAIRRVRPDSWRGNLPREQIIKQALFEIVGYEVDVESLFAIVFAQREY